MWGGEFEMTWACALRQDRQIAANMWLYWSFMYEMIRRGMHQFNFGRCTPGSGTHRSGSGRQDLPPPGAERLRVLRRHPSGDAAFAWGPLCGAAPLPANDSVPG
jgi:hypothetical protein